MQPDSSAPIHLVQDANTLQSCVQELNQQRVIAVDLEFDSHRHAYGVTLCLVQVGTPDVCYIVDPFRFDEGGLDRLYDVFEDERIQKVMHSPGEDLRLLHALACYPKNVFDTEVVAKLLNYEHTSLASLLHEKLGYILSKGQQRSNWLRRPLTQDQIAYAAADVAWLHPLKAILEEEAVQKGLMPYVAEEQATLSTTIYQPERKTFFLKPSDLYTLSPYEQHVLNGLFIYRDELAQNLNKPAYQVIDESLLRQLAAGTLQPRALLHAKGVYGSFKNTRFADKLSARLDDIYAEAEKSALSRELLPGNRRLTAGRIDKKQADRDKEEKFAPIQAALVARFGTHAARFILSNSTVNNLLRQTLTIASLKLNYRREIIMGIAGELGIDLSSYE